MTRLLIIFALFVSIARHSPAATLNLIEGTNVTLRTTNVSGAGRVDVQINAAGGGAGEVSTAQLLVVSNAVNATNVLIRAAFGAADTALSNLVAGFTADTNGINAVTATNIAAAQADLARLAAGLASTNLMNATTGALWSAINSLSGGGLTSEQATNLFNSLITNLSSLALSGSNASVLRGRDATLTNTLAIAWPTSLASNYTLILPSYIEPGKYLTGTNWQGTNLVLYWATPDGGNTNLTGTLKLLVLGDSMSEWNQGAGGISWVQMLTNADRRFSDAANLSVSGVGFQFQDLNYTTNASLFTSTNTYKKVAVVWLGNNDINTNWQTICGWASNMVRRAKSDGCYVVELGLGPRGDVYTLPNLVAEQNRVIFNVKRETESLADIYVPIQRLFPETNSLFFRDHIHLTTNGHQRVMWAVAEALASGQRMAQQVEPLSSMVSSNRWRVVYTESGIPALYIDGASGHVGIGTTTPNNTLSVQGPIGSYGDQSIFNLVGPNSTVAMYKNDYYLKGAAWSMTGGDDQFWRTFNSTNGGWVDRMWLKTDTGRLGIGTNDPSASLEVHGTVKALDFQLVGGGSVGGTSGTNFDGIVVTNTGKFGAIEIVSTNAGRFDIKGAGGTSTNITLDGASGTVTAAEFAGDGRGITGLWTNAAINRERLLIEYLPQPGNRYVPNSARHFVQHESIMPPSEMQFANWRFWGIYGTGTHAEDGVAINPYGAPSATRFWSTNGVEFFIGTYAVSPIPDNYVLSGWFKGGSTNCTFRMRMGSANSAELTAYADRWTLYSFTNALSGSPFIGPVVEDASGRPVDILLWGVQCERGSRFSPVSDRGWDLQLGSNGAREDVDPWATNSFLAFNSATNNWAYSWSDAPLKLDRVSAYALIRTTAVGGSLVAGDRDGASLQFMTYDHVPWFTFGTNFLASSFINLADTNWHVVTWTTDGTNTGRLYVDGTKVAEATNFALPTLVETSELWLGNLSFSGFANMDLGGFWLYNSAHSGTDVAAMQRAIVTDRTAIAVPQKGVLAFLGDSITEGANINPLDKWTYRLATNLFPRVPAWNHAVGGYTFAETTNKCASLDELLIGCGSNKVMTVLLGANDLASTNATAFVANMKSLCNARRAKGWKVVLMTVLPQNNSTINTRRAEVNIAYRNDPTFYDALADIAADPTIGPDAAALDTNLYSDQVHPTALGAYYIYTNALSHVTRLLGR